MTQNESTRFPGPQPYDEDQHHLFSAREREVERMVNATFERLGVLSADSGAGKSSLLAAGYVPELRRLRATRGGAPPVLLLRSWGGRAAAAENRIRDGVRHSVEKLDGRARLWAQRAPTLPSPILQKRANDIALSIARDHLRLSEILRQFNFEKTPHGPPVTEVLQALSDEEGLILILDQFEEFMGSASAEREGDQRTAERVTQAVGRLFRDVPKLRILIALRTEYCRTLQRYLNPFVPNLDRRVIDLSPLPPKSLIQIVRRVAATDTPDTVIEEFAEKVALASGATKGDDSSSVSVLEAQALLSGYDAWCMRSLASSEFPLTLWDEYVEHLMSDAISDEPARWKSGGGRGNATDARVGRTALKVWVENQLDLAVGSARTEAGQRARWMLLPVLPRLSTQGGYKQHLPLLDLCLDLADRLFDGAGKLEPVKRRVESWLNKGPDAEFALETRDLRDLRMQGADGPTQAAVDTLEDMRRLIHDSIVAFRRTLKNLAPHILKMSGSDRDESCELVHDGLSPHVRKWSEDLPKSPETLLGSPVEVVGERFAWRELGGGERQTIADKKWTGCSLKARGKTRITKVTFENCEFRGLSLTDCILEDVSFVRCRMPGAIMIACTLTNVTFDSCKLISAAFIDCVFAGAKFRGSLPKLGATIAREIWSDMTGIDIYNCALQPGSLMEFTECLLRFAKIARIAFGGGNRMTFVKCDMMNAWVEDAGMPVVVIDEHCRTIGLLSFTLPDEGWLERESRRRSAEDQQP